MGTYQKNQDPSTGSGQGFSLIEVLVTIVILMIGLLGLAGLQGRAFTVQMESYQRAQALVLLDDMADRIMANRNVASCYAVATQTLGTGMTTASVVTTNPCNGYATVPGTDISSYTTRFCSTTGSCTASYCVLVPNPPLGAVCPPLNFLPPVMAPAQPTYAAQTADQRAVAIAINRAVSGAPTALTDLKAWNDALNGVAEAQGASNIGAMIGARGCIYQVVAPAPPTGPGLAGTPGQYNIVVAWQGVNNTAKPDVSTATSAGQCGFNQYKNSAGAVDETLHRVITLPVTIGWVS